MKLSPVQWKKPIESQLPLVLALMERAEENLATSDDNINLSEV